VLYTRDNSRVYNITWRPVPKRRNKYNYITKSESLFFGYIIIGIMGLIMVIWLLPSLELAFGNGTQPGPDLLGYILKIYFRPEKAEGLDTSTLPS